MKRTYQPKKRKRARTHGFCKRSKSAGGRSTLKRRRRKGCRSLSATDRNVKRKRKHRSKVR